MPSSFPTTPSAAGAVPKVIVIQLTEQELMRTDGSNTTWLLNIIEARRFARLGPNIAKLRVELEVESATANFSIRFTTAWSVSGRQWAAPSEIFASVTGNQQLIGAWFSDDSKFGIHMRVAAEVKNAAGTAIESARVTAYLVIETKS